MKHILATLSVIALLALPGCACKKDSCSKPKTEQCKDKKAACSKDKNMKKDSKDTKKKGCKSCKDDKKKPAYSKQSYLELEPAEEKLV